MKLSLFIARRYFLSKRKKNFINIISILSMVGIAFATAALVIVLSVFNGLEGLLRTLNYSFDPQIKIEAKQGKTFEASPKLLADVQATSGVNIVTEVVEDYCLLRYRDADMVVTMKGLSNNFLDQHRLDEHKTEGELILQDSTAQYAILGIGVQGQLSVPIDESLYPLLVYYIRNGKTISLDPSKLYSSGAVQAAGVFSIEKNIDENYVLLPIDFVRRLTGYEGRCTSLDVQVKADADAKKVKEELQKKIGDSFEVLTNDEQHKDLYKLVNVEKLFSFSAMAILIGVASINIFFSLMMLAIDKKKDISVLFALGGGKSLIRRIFLQEGGIIAFTGAGAGLIFGGGLCWAQQQFGMVSMGMGRSIVNAYPVEMRFFDFVAVAIVIVLITTLSSFYPAILASRSYSITKL